MIAILRPGDMGAALGSALVAAGHDVGWLPLTRSAETDRRARDRGFAELTSLDGVDVIVSLCPPSAAVDVAHRTAGFPGIYVDANAVAPETARSIAALMPNYVDGSVIGPPPTEHGTTRLYLSGKRADAVAALFADTVVDARVLPGAFDASALKMAYAGWTKVSAAVLLATFVTATELGVANELMAEWTLSQPGLAEKLIAAQRSAASKGWRWAGEMREIAATQVAFGLPGGFGDGAAEIYDGYARR